MVDLQQIFINALSPNAQVRKEAEATLASIETHPGFVVDLINYFENSDSRVQQISSIIFKNSAIAQWHNPEFQGQKDFISANIVNLILNAKGSIKANIVNLLKFVLENESIENWTPILKQSSAMLQEQHNPMAINTALTVISCVAKTDKIKYDSEKSEMVIGPIFPYLVGMLEHSCGQSAFETRKILVKLIANLQDPYFTPKHLTDVNLTARIYKVNAEIISIDDRSHNEELYNHKKWAVKFFTRVFSKYLKNKGGRAPVKDYVLDQQNVVSIFNIVMNAIKHEIKAGYDFSNDQENFLSACVAFLNVLSSEKHFDCSFMKNEVDFIIFCFIYPLHVFNEDDEHRFCHEPTEYIRDKYNYYAVDLRGFTSLLFNAILKRFKADKQLKQHVFDEFARIMNAYAINPSIENARKKHGALWLISSSPKFIMMGYDEFINKYIVPDLFSGFDCLISQAFFSLQNFSSSSVSDQTANLVFDGIVKGLESHKEIVRTEAIFAIQFVLECKPVVARLKAALPLIIQGILEIQGKNEVEAMNDLLKNITIGFPEEITAYFPQLVDLFSKAIISGITSLNDDKISLFTSYLDTTIYLLDALENKPELVYSLYCISAEMLYSIFSNQAYDLYSNAIELFSEIVYSLKKIDNSMWSLFSVIMQLPESDKVDSSGYLVSLIDNFVSYGTNRVCEQINPILKFVEIMTKPADSCFMDDEYQYGCQIIDALILHLNQGVSELIPFFIDCILKNYEEIDRDSSLIINCLDSLMNCFAVNFPLAWAVVSKHNHTQVFFDDLFEARNKFIRCYDKKIALIFSSILLKIQDPALESIDVIKFKRFFLKNIKTLSAAIAKRDNLLQKDDNEVDESNEEKEDEVSYCDLREEIYFITPIDNLDVFSSLKDTFSCLGSFGIKLLNNMDACEKQTITEIITAHCQNN